MKENDVVDYIAIATEVGKLVTNKQGWYGNSFGHSPEILRILYPNGVSVDQYENFLYVVRMMDKIFRVANGDNGNESAFFDICGYALLAIGNNSGHINIDSIVDVHSNTNNCIISDDFKKEIERIALNAIAREIVKSGQLRIK
jgi:hypothetical protein